MGGEETEVWMIVDIHCHILYGVDDGSDSEQTSRQIIDIMAKQQITDVIVTPHFRRHMFPHPAEKIEEAYQNLSGYAQTKGIHLYPGCEYHVDHDIFHNLQNGRVHTLADTRYVLTEYSYTDDLSRIVEYTQELVMRGYQPVIAHAERCQVFQRKPKLIYEATDAGALIQLNAGSVLGKEGWGVKKTARKLLDLEAADFIASDTHDLDERACHMEECFELVSRKYGEKTARRLFHENAQQILNSRK